MIVETAYESESSSGFYRKAFLASATEAVKRWKFRPATQGGRPVNVYFILTVNFKVQ